MRSLILMFLLATAIDAHTQKTTLKIAVVYFSPIDQALKKELVKNISSTYNCTINELPGIYTLPVNAYYKPRNRYRALQILDYLKTIKGYDKVIGITAKDISTTMGTHYDWGIMGLARSPGKPCVISTYRIMTPNKKLFNDRFIKIALHELGHTTGIPHCKLSTTCFMHSADGTVKSVDRETRFMCTHCNKKLNS